MVEAKPKQTADENGSGVLPVKLTVRCMESGDPIGGVFLVWAPIVDDAASVPYSVEFSDAGGYFMMARQDENPWQHLTRSEKQRTASLKLAEGQTYRFLFVAHPNVSVAMEAKRLLDAGEPLATQDIRLSREGTAGYLRLDVPTSPASYYPGGHERYNGWLLFKNMPYADQTGVREQVRRVARDLAALRYPTGPSSSPYLGQLEHDGDFGLGLMACVASFQHHAATGRACMRSAEANERAGGSGRSSDWAQLVARESKVAALEAEFALGVVDKPTVDALEAWLAAGARKPGDVLVPLHSPELWGRVDLALRFFAWRALSRAFELAYEIAAGSSLRSLAAAGGVGRKNASIHKVGVAVDLSSGTFREPSRRFPVAFEAHWFFQDRVAARTKRALSSARRDKEKTDKLITRLDEGIKHTDQRIEALERELGAELDASKRNVIERELVLERRNRERAAADIAKASAKARSLAEQIDKHEQEIAALVSDPDKNAYRLRFCLYGHSRLDAFALPPEQMAKTIERAMRGEDGRGGARQAFESAVDEVLPSFRDERDEALRESLLEPYRANLDAAIERLIALAGEAIEGEPHSRLAEEFFRREVHRFEMRAFERDGGRSLPSVAAQADAVPFAVPNPESVRSWLNLTRLGFAVGMWRISARDSEFRYQPGLAGKDGRTTARVYVGENRPKRRPKDTDFLFSGVPETIDTIVQGIEFAQDQLQWTHIEAYAGKRRPKKRDEIMRIPIEEIDLDGLDDWMPRPSDVAKLPRNVWYEGVDMLIQLSADDDERKAQVKFFGKRKCQRVEVVSVGEALASELLDIGEAYDGDKLLELLTQVVPRQTKDAPSTREACTLRLRPVAIPAPRSIVGHTFEIPAHGSARALEWWHYEGALVGRHGWVELASQIGYHRDVLLASDRPTTNAAPWVPGMGVSSKELSSSRSEADPENEPLDAPAQES